MKPKRRRFVFLVLGALILSAAVGLVLVALEEDIVFFYSPSEIDNADVPRNRMIRIGGLVEEGSLLRGQGATITFAVTDLDASIAVAYTGILPDLFREGQGVVIAGRLKPDGSFIADEVLAKHDETYMPPEVADALKKSGQWKEGAAQ
jgi:cytochrome c-type biogenesis protein CcmE